MNDSGGPAAPSTAAADTGDVTADDTDAGGSDDTGGRVRDETGADLHHTTGAGGPDDTADGGTDDTGGGGPDDAAPATTGGRSSSKRAADEPDPRRWKALTVCLVAGFMTLLDVSIVNVALPSIQSGIGASPSDLQWVVSGYALTFGLTLVGSGRIGDAIGRWQKMDAVAGTAWQLRDVRRA